MIEIKKPTKEQITNYKKEVFIYFLIVVLAVWSGISTWGNLSWYRVALFVLGSYLGFYAFFRAIYSLVSYIRKEYFYSGEFDHLVREYFEFYLGLSITWLILILILSFNLYSLIIILCFAIWFIYLATKRYNFFVESQSKYFISGNRIEVEDFFEKRIGDIEEGMSLMVNGAYYGTLLKGGESGGRYIVSRTFQGTINALCYERTHKLTWKKKEEIILLPEMDLFKILEEKLKQVYA